MLTVHLRINDQAMGKPTPVRLRISDAAGRFYPPLGRFAEFPTGRNEAVGGHLLLNGEAWCYIDGSCEVPLPAGVPLRVQATKGPEYTPLDETVTLGPGQMALRFTIQRHCLDAREKGFHSGDSRCHFLSPHDALLEAAAEDLDVVNLLAAEETRESIHTVSNLTAFSGQAAALEENGRLVAVNTLNTHAVLGKVGLLFSHRPIFPLTALDWSICDWCDQCHRKGGLTVWVEAFQDTFVEPLGGEALVAAILGKIDAIEITEYLPAQMEWIYRMWNAGYLIQLIGGSGKASNRVPLGAMRTYARMEDGEAFTYKAWIEAVRAGRSFITNGPLFPSIFGYTAHAFDFEEISDKSDFGHINDVTRVGGWWAVRFTGMEGSFAHHPPKVHHPLPRHPSAIAPLIRAVESTRRWIETTGRFEQPKRKQSLIDRCNEALAKLGAVP